MVDALGQRHGVVPLYAKRLSELCFQPLALLGQQRSETLAMSLKLVVVKEESRQEPAEL